MKLSLGLGVAVLLLGLSAVQALAADTLRIAVQRTGTVAWELAVAKARGLDKAADLDIRIEELASTEAGKISLRGGAVDMIVSDWLWVARERGLGDDLLFTPYSTALGAVMAPKTSTIASLADLKGKSIGIAGGPLDKSWLMLRALARRSGLDLAKQTRPIYGAPPLIAAKLIQGEIDAALEFWNFCADLEAHGFKRVIEMSDVEKRLGAKGPVAMTGYVFSSAFARTHGPALKRFFAMLAKAHEALATDPAAWAPVRARMRATDAATFEAYRRVYLAGAPKRPVADEATDARALFKAIADVSGTELTGGAKDLDVAAFYDPGR
ncbi:MAG TPA: ABC transporter substrate-binding protein [Roseiarcus sp.]|nr:ABC transporter substrate-binding protein [Roseiarcus sp.]